MVCAESWYIEKGGVMRHIGLFGRIHAVTSLILLGLAVVLSSCTTADGKGWAPVPDKGPAGEPREPVGEVASALTGTQKVCRAFVGGNWSDTIVVPNAWNGGMCQSWAGSIGGNQWQMGCFFDWGYSWGGFNGGLPPANCGWY